MNSSEPLVSIIVPAYNRASYIGICVQSILNQNYPRFEIIVVDDGSTDNTAEIVAAFQDPRVRFFQKKHEGAPACRNYAVAQSRGEYILSIDSDDVMMKDILSHHVKTAASFPDADIFYGNIVAANEELNPIRSINYEDWYNRNSDLIASSFRMCSVPNPGTMFSKKCFEAVGGYDTSFRRAHDYKFWTMAASRFKFKHVGALTAIWRWHSNNLSPVATPNGVTEVDTSFEAAIVKEMLLRYSLKELFPYVDWNNKSIRAAEAECYLYASLKLAEHKDIEGALDYARKSNSLFPNKDSLRTIDSLTRLSRAAN